MTNPIYKYFLATVKSTLSLSLGALALLLSANAQATELRVQVDQVESLKLPQAAETIVIGNPVVADINAQSKELFFVVGRTMGTTNVVALDRAGKTIANILVHVTSPDNRRVVLHRSTDRLSYSCIPNCERTQIPGDATGAYKEIEEENKKKIELAKSGRDASVGGR